MGKVIRHRRRPALDPTGWANLKVPRPSATMGDILAWRRKQKGLTHVQIARWDGKWTPEQVAELEGCRTISSTEVARYLRALDRYREDQ